MYIKTVKIHYTFSMKNFVQGQGATLDDWTFCELHDALYYSEKGKDSLKKYGIFEFRNKKKVNTLWDNFKIIEEIYVKNKFTYKIYETSSKYIYEEFTNATPVKTINFDKDNIYIEILKLTNKSVVTFNCLCDKLNKIHNEILDPLIIKEALTKLYNEALIYYNNKFDGIISIINIESII